MMGTSSNLLVSDSRIPYWIRKKIKSTAVWNDLYTRNEGEKEVDDFEKWFDRELESPVKMVFDNLLMEHNLDEDESTGTGVKRLVFEYWGVSYE